MQILKFNNVPSDLNSSIPISPTCILINLTERIIVNHFLFILHCEGYVSKRQANFGKSNTTTKQTLDVFHKVQNIVEISIDSNLLLRVYGGKRLLKAPSNLHFWSSSQMVFYFCFFSKLMCI